MSKLRMLLIHSTLHYSKVLEGAKDFSVEENDGRISNVLKAISHVNLTKELGENLKDSS